jgi:transcriptional regulator with XRE-family HTH domain
MTAFAAHLRRSMDRKGMSAEKVARASGISRHSVGQYLWYDRLPTAERALMLSEALDDPALHAFVVTARTRTCDCGRSYLDGGRGKPKGFCSTTCYHRVKKRTDRAEAKAYTVALTTRERDSLRAAVHDFCRECTAGEGICRTLECPLRAHSPYPFIAINRRAA